MHLALECPSLGESFLTLLGSGQAVQDGIACLISWNRISFFTLFSSKKPRFLSGLRSQCSRELVASADLSHPCKAQLGLGCSTLIPPKSTEPSGQLVAVAAIQGGFSL